MESLKLVSGFKKNRGDLNKRSKFGWKPIQLGWIWTILFLLGAAGFVTMTTFYIQPGSFKGVIRLILQQPLILVVNYLPPLLVLLLFYFIINNVCYSAAITGAIFNFLSLINTVKVELRDDPFVPRDLQLLQEAGEAISSFEIKLNYILVFLMIISIVVFIIGGRFLKFKKLPIGVKIGGAVAAILAAYLSNAFIYSSKDIYYHKLHVSSRSYITRVYTELGFTYCFLYNLNTYPVEKPENFSKEEVEKWIQEYHAANIESPKVKPHVFIVMNEAFSDISNDPKFAYNQDNDPLKNFKELAKSPNAISGHLVVPGFGGGTANTEFDVMTGMQTNLLNSVATSAFRVVGRNTQSLARIFKKNDYQTFFLHPGESWFYNRFSVYKYFGIEDQIYSEAFSKEDYKGNMVSDKVTMQRLIEQFETRTAENDAPIFGYITTIQNHMVYTVKKYGDLPIEQAPVKGISQEAKDYFSVYLEGVRDADQMLKDLTDYFNDQDESVVLVFFGDHLPNLGENYLAYKALGLDVGNEDSVDQVINTYSTPYIIWSNQAAGKTMNLSELAKQLGLSPEKKLNANFLGATLLELLDFKGQDEYMDFLNDLRKEIPVFYKNYYQTKDGKYTNQLTEQQQMLIDKMHKWEYYKLKYEKVNR